ncbi:MAG: glycogen/starch/alpha-glucan phosphorylase [Bacillales bacterium]|nr:glycogen/starch/alpha-glucan phosphorylase [Mollicutes bacterium]MCI7213887.1 glycogen/starch/alpha-glucan phosphorylase [Bacillales bacterium]MDD7715601.1 glycogen/starch/alpha-glucan phosphorylase [Mollicutes bacterium]MDY3904551.1 glycogen/starch/alpha-glucan phosphorylase [Candidatus Enteromonas sp.]MDY4936492.1 glycogen/starch/alpha-glucan phosphorylase [Candidatus Enteromonas sp.]
MFDNKEDFKATFSRRLEEKYGRAVDDSHITERYDILGEMIRDYAGHEWRESRESILRDNKKQLIYFSMEFLMGRLMTSNMQNLGIYDVARDGLEELGIDIGELEDIEADAGLGNGGLGRLAACFLDSIASLGYPGHGNTIRYEYGFFRQKFVNGQQVELPDQWLSNGFVFEVRKPKHAVEVSFYGNAETYLKPDGGYGLRTVNATHVRAVPYDVSIPGYRNGVANTLRLWSAEPSENNLPTDQSFEDYLNTLKELCHGLYPDDSTEHGRMLRLRQQYFLVSAGLQSAMRSYKQRYGSLDDFASSYVFQLNDTHPILAIPEAMRLLLDEYGYGWDEAWNIVTKMFAYTNHTVMPEALEKWPVQYVQHLVPRVYMIIEEINRRFNILLSEKNVSDSARYQMQIIKDGQIHMTNMAIYTGFSVNGVAKIHTKILEEYTFKDFYELFPNKFNNKTNGVTHRRWLMYANPRLAAAIDRKIGTNWRKDFEHEICKLKKFADDKDFQKEIMDIKHQNKVDFASFCKKNYGIEVDPNSIFDVQIKRLHAYKRQLLNLFHIMYLYQKLKEDPTFSITPHTYIFGAKAAPSYVYAKKIIELILAVAKVVDEDPRVSKFIKIVFVENYGVSLAEKIIPAADISEQISTAGKEASGTSNMKLMMNGALTLGTLDGANIEIADFAGNENEIIFGLKENEIQKMVDEGSYNPWDIYNSDIRVKNIMDSLFTGPWCKGDNNKFRMIFDEIMARNDQFFVLADFNAYNKACQEADQRYQDESNWARSAILNIASSGYFTSDRTIEEYNKDIWHLEKLSK